MDKEIEIIELNFDVIPVIKGDFFQGLFGDNIYHINYNVLKTDYEKNKDKIIKELCYHLQFRDINMPEVIQKADILIIVDRIMKKVIDIVIKGYIDIEVLKELKNIENPDVVQYRLRRILEDEI